MKKYTKKDFDRDYPTDDVCLQTIFTNRYGSDYKCPECGRKGKFHKIEGRKRYDCQCGYSLHPLAGTIFHKSETPLTDWFYAIYLFASSRNGVSAKEIERQIGCTYKTAWRMAKQIRLLFSQNSIPFSGTVELDETYVGGKAKKKRGRGADKKTAVFGIVSRKGKIKARVVPNVKEDTLLPILNESVKKNSNVMTDEFLSYNKVGLNGYKHQTIKHAVKEYARGKVHTNNIESFWGQLKRSIDGTHHAVSPKYLQTYVDEFAFRWNERNCPTSLFEAILLQVAKRA